MPLLGGGGVLYRAASAAYSENEVTFSSNRLRGGQIDTANRDWMLFFLCGTFANTAGANEYIAMSGGATYLNYIRRGTSGQIACVWQNPTPAAQFSMTAAGVNFTGAGEKFASLILLDSYGTSRIHSCRDSGGWAWAESTTDTTGGSAGVYMTASTWSLGSDDGTSPTAYFPGTMIRFAVFAGANGTQPDISSGTVRDYFFNTATGLAVDPATSVSALGTPLWDVYGPAADYNALVNEGSRGSWASKTGTFADA